MQSHFNIITPAIQDALNQDSLSEIQPEERQRFNTVKEIKLPHTIEVNYGLRVTAREAERIPVLSDPDFRY